METVRSKLIFIFDSSNDSKTKKLQATKMENELWLLEGKVHDIWQTGARQDIFRNPAQLLERFLAVSKESTAGGSADFPPTDQDNEVYEQLNNQLQQVLSDYSVVKKNLVSIKRDLKIKSTFKNNPNKN